MRMLVNSQYLELADNIKLQFTKKNILFAFDDIECERSTSFDVPATPTNTAIFGFSNINAAVGSGMRTRFSAQMQAGSVAKDGYIYVSEYDFSKKVYKCIFVTGDLLGLKAIQSGGNLADYLLSDLYVDWTSANEVDANSASGSSNYAEVKYKHTTNTVCFPSSKIEHLISLCATHFGVTVTLPSYSLATRVVPASLEPLTKSTLKISTQQNVDQSGYPDYALNDTESELHGLVVAYETIPFTQRQYICFIDEGGDLDWQRDGVLSYDTLAGWKAYQDITLDFPSNWSNDVFLVSELFPDVWSPQTYGTEVAQFYGEYMFGDTGIVSGTPLAGRSIAISAGQKFAFINKNDYVNIAPTTVGQITQAYYFAHNGQRYHDHGQPSSTYTLAVSQVGDIASGSRIFLQANFPDVTFIDLLKTYAVLRGRVLNYDSTNGITFDQLTSWEAVKSLENVISKNTMTRTFSDYAQDNIIDFASGDDVRPKYKIESNYAIENDSLEEEKTLYTVPFSEGNIGTNNGSEVTLISTDDDGASDADTIAIANVTSAGNTMMERVSLTNVSKLEELCEASTSLKVTARMTLREYEDIEPKQLFYYDGCEWVWTEAQWSNDVVTLSLSKI